MSTESDITLGSLAEIEGHFEDVDGQSIDPTNLTLLVVDPSGVGTQLDPGNFEHVELGFYRMTFSPTLPGTHRFLWLGTGARPVSVDGEFYVREPVTATPEGWQPPSAGIVWDQSRLDFEAAGYSSATLQPLVDEAVAWVAWATGRPMDSTLPVGLQPLGRAAIRMRTEQIVMRTDADAIQSATQEGISSVSVSGLSVSFRDPRSSAGLGNARGASGSPFPTSWDALNEVLLALMTPERLEEWRYQVAGQYVPDFAVSEQFPGFGGDFEDPWHGYGGPAEWPGWGLG